MIGPNPSLAWTLTSIITAIFLGIVAADIRNYLISRTHPKPTRKRGTTRARKSVARGGGVKQVDDEIKKIDEALKKLGESKAVEKEEVGETVLDLTPSKPSQPPASSYTQISQVTSDVPQSAADSSEPQKEETPEERRARLLKKWTYGPTEELNTDDSANSNQSDESD